MADIAFVRENPFTKVWAEGDERDRRAAVTNQQMRASEQQIAASQQSVRASEETMRVAREQRDQANAVDSALGQAATGMANPLERVTAREVPDWNAAINLPETPAMATENVRETVRRGLPNAGVVSQLAGVKGGGKVAYELATAGRKQESDDDGKFIELLSKDPQAAIMMFESRGQKLPEGFKNNRTMLAELKGMAAALKDLPEELRDQYGPALFSKFLGVEVPKTSPKIDFYDSTRGVGINRRIGVVPIPNLPDRETGRGQGTGAEPKPLMPKIIKTEDGGLMDQNTGAFATWKPPVAAQPGKTRFFGPNDPDTPAQPGRWEWQSPDGRSLPNGPQSMYEGGRPNVSAGPTPGPAAGPAPVPPAAIEFLRANPNAAEAFRAKYGIDPAPYLRTAAPSPAPSAAAPTPRPAVAQPTSINRAYAPVPDPPGQGSTPQQFNEWERQYGEQYRINQELVAGMQRADNAENQRRTQDNSLAARLRRQQAEQGNR